MQVVRLARVEDAEAIARIYNQGIAERIATFETEPRSIEQIAEDLHEAGDRYPRVVVERDGQVVAWASVHAYRARECYRGVGEHSVYSDRAARGTGAGAAALDGLFVEARRRGFWKLLSRIFTDNAPSRALHRKLGFREVGIYRGHAQLDGEWKDCVIVERLLNEPIRDRIDERLRTLGLALPAAVTPPAGARLPFAFVRVRGNRALVAGHGPLQVDGSLAGPFGKVGAEVSVDEAYQSARLVGLAALGSLKRELGSLDRISAWLRVFGMVNAAPGFREEPRVINGFSDLILEVFGPEIGQHARSAIGVAELPWGIPVEVEAEVEIDG